MIPAFCAKCMRPYVINCRTLAVAIRRATIHCNCGVVRAPSEDTK